MQISEIGISAVVCNQEFCSEVDKKKRVSRIFGWIFLGRILSHSPTQLSCVDRQMIIQIELDGVNELCFACPYHLKTDILKGSSSLLVQA